MLFLLLLLRASAYVGPFQRIPPRRAKELLHLSVKGVDGRYAESQVLFFSQPCVFKHNRSFTGVVERVHRTSIAVWEQCGCVLRPLISWKESRMTHSIYPKH